MAMVGDRIDRFTLVRQLGAGGMGATWEAVRQSGNEFEQRVAIKLANREHLATPDGLAAFRREAALAASLRHPNIAAVLDVDETVGCIVCELVDGADLRAVLRAAPGGTFEPAITVHIIGQIARGLSHAHRRILRGRPSPVIHRDMSPGNVVIDYDGNVKIVDFGIAQVMVGGVAPAESLKGKLAYMAPEQAMGSRMDGRSDQYALGVIAYEALSGARPNQGAHEGETLGCILAGKHVPLLQRAPSVPKGLANVVERMLALRPEQRFATFDAMLDALAEFTPPLTVHRALVPLVVAARQPHTIVRENGRFISRPVEAEPLLQQVSAAEAMVSAARLQGVATTPALPSPRDSGGLLGVLALQPDGRRTPVVPGLAAQAFAPTLGSLPLTRRDSAPSSPGPAPASGRSSSPSRAPVKRTPSVLERVLDSRAFWQGLTVLGAALLAFVMWVAFSPSALTWLWPRAVNGRQPRAPASSAVHSTAPARVQTSWRPQLVAAVKAADGSVVAEVPVSPVDPSASATDPTAP